MWYSLLILIIVALLIGWKVMMSRVLKYGEEVKRELVAMKISNNPQLRQHALRAVCQMQYNFWKGLETLRKCKESEEEKLL